MGFGHRLILCLLLVLVGSIHSRAQERSPLFERAVTNAAVAPVSPSILGEFTQSSGTRSGGRDSLLNGTIIGAAIGAAAGMALAYATNDSVLGVEQYSYAALVFGGIGAGIGLGVDALLNRGSGVAVGSPRRIGIKTGVTRKAAAVGVTMRW
jgi:hypothetical protein